MNLDVSFLLCALLFFLVLALLWLFAFRRLRLRRALGTIDASFLSAKKGWQMGVCRYQDTHLEWFRLFSLSPKPVVTFRRSSLELVERRKPTAEELSLVQVENVIVVLRYEGQDYCMAMRLEAYAGLSSWIEAGPVVGIGIWR